jgi:hypothetical protein
VIERNHSAALTGFARMFDQVELEKLRKVFVTDLAGTLMRAMRLCEDWRTRDLDLGYVSTRRVGFRKRSDDRDGSSSGVEEFEVHD